MAQTNMGIALPNDEARQAFLRDYTNAENGWYLWIEVPQIKRRWYRRDFEGWSIVIEESDHVVKTKVAGFVFPKTKMVMHMYMVEDWDLPLESNLSVKTQIMSRLRELTRDGGTI